MRRTGGPAVQPGIGLSAKRFGMEEKQMEVKFGKYRACFTKGGVQLKREGTLFSGVSLMKLTA